MKTEQEELEQRVSVSFHLLHLFWKDHLCREGHLPDLWQHCKYDRSFYSAFCSIGSPHENGLRLFSYFMKP